MVSLHVLRAAGLVPIGFLDDDPTRHEALIADMPVLGDTAWLTDSNATDVSAFVAIGDNTVRRTIAERLRRGGSRRS